MSRVAKSPIKVPNGTEVKINGQEISVKGAKGSLSLTLHSLIAVTQEDNVLQVAPKDLANKDAWKFAGTMRANLNNLVVGCTTGFEKKLQLLGVGYRAALKGQVVNLTLGFSHPINYQLPEGVTAELPTQTEILLKSADKQKLGQAAAEIRQFRPPEPYKGKGVRYADEHVRRKEAKKK